MGHEDRGSWDWEQIPQEYRPRLVVADRLVDLFREAYGPGIEIIPISETYLPTAKSKGEQTMTEVTRAEHLAWCKQRALEYVDVGDVTNAWASMASDLTKHPETEKHAAIQLGMMMLMSGQLATRDQMRKFINGFN